MQFAPSLTRISRQSLARIRRSILKIWHLSWRLQDKRQTKSDSKETNAHASIQYDLFLMLSTQCLRFIIDCGPVIVHSSLIIPRLFLSGVYSSFHFDSFDLMPHCCLCYSAPVMGCCWHLESVLQMIIFDLWTPITVTWDTRSSDPIFSFLIILPKMHPMYQRTNLLLESLEPWRIRIPFWITTHWSILKFALPFYRKSPHVFNSPWELVGVDHFNKTSDSIHFSILLVLFLHRMNMFPSTRWTFCPECFFNSEHSFRKGSRYLECRWLKYIWQTTHVFESSDVAISILLHFA